MFKYQDSVLSFLLRIQCSINTKVTEVNFFDNINESKKNFYHKRGILIL
jgi:hypothetical protein